MNVRCLKNYHINDYDYFIQNNNYEIINNMITTQNGITYPIQNIKNFNSIFEILIPVKTESSTTIKLAPNYIFTPKNADMNLVNSFQVISARRRYE